GNLFHPHPGRRRRHEQDLRYRARPQLKIRRFGSPAHVLSPAHEFFCSRKLRLAPQDYSPWTPPLDRFLVRSYPPASRHPRVLDLVGPYHGVQCHPERSEPASEVEGSATRRVQRLGRGSFASTGSHPARLGPDTCTALYFR